MKKNRLFSFFTALFMMIGMIGTIPASAEAAYINITVSGKQINQMAWDCLELVNAERRAAGARELVMDKTMMEVAAQRAAELKISFDHNRPDGQECWYGWSPKIMSEFTGARGENIAYGYDSGEDMYNGWKNSEGHHRNFMNERFVKTGLACVEILNEYNHPVHYWVQVFSSAASTGEYTQHNSPSFQRNVRVLNSDENKEKYVPDTPVLVSTTLNANHTVTVTWKWNIRKNNNGREICRPTAYRLLKYDQSVREFKICQDNIDGTVASSSDDGAYYFTYTDNNVQGGFTKYKVLAFKSVDSGTKTKSFNSNQKSVYVKPAVPVIYDSTIGTNSVTLKWTLGDCAGYKVYRYNPDDGRNYLLTDLPGSSNTSYTIEGLRPGQQYQFRVRSYYKIVDKVNGVEQTSYVHSNYSDIYIVNTARASAIGSDIDEIDAFGKPDESGLEPEYEKTEEDTDDIFFDENMIEDEDDAA